MQDNKTPTLSRSNSSESNTSVDFDPDLPQTNTQQLPCKGFTVGMSIGLVFDVALLVIAFTSKYSNLAKTNVGIAILTVSCIAIPIICTAISALIEYFCNKPNTCNTEVNTALKKSTIGK